MYLNVNEVLARHQGEEVKKLDVLSNDLFINMLRSSYSCCLLVSEENETVIEIDAAKQVEMKAVFAFFQYLKYLKSSESTTEDKLLWSLIS